MLASLSRILSSGSGIHPGISRLYGMTLAVPFYAPGRRMTSSGLRAPRTTNAMAVRLAHSPQIDDTWRRRVSRIRAVALCNSRMKPSFAAARVGDPRAWN